MLHSLTYTRNANEGTETRKTGYTTPQQQHRYVCEWLPMMEVFFFFLFFLLFSSLLGRES